MRRGAIAFIFALSCLVGRGEWVTEVVTNITAYDCADWINPNNNAVGFVTDFYGDQDTRYEIMTTAACDQFSIIGCDDGATGRNGFALQKWGKWLIGYRNGYEMSSSSAAVNMGVFSVVANSMYLNGTLLCSATYGQYTYSFPILICGTNRSGSYKHGSGKSYQIYYIKAESSISGRRHWIPIVENDVAKMLDIQNNRVYEPSGTGAFSYGNITGTVDVLIITTNRTYRANHLPSDSSSPFNRAPTSLGGSGRGDDGTTLRPTAHFDIKNDMED